MPNTLKNELAQNVGTSAAMLYTCPANTKTIIIGMTAANVLSNANINLDIYITSSSNDYHIIKNGTIAPGGTLVPMGGEQKVILEPGDIVKAKSTAASSADIIMSIVEQT